MIKKVAQIIIADSVSKKDINILENYGPVTQLGIQAAPGTTFKINNGGEITVGNTGVYELDLEGGLGQIHELKFTEELILNNEYPKVFIDIVYESQEA